MTFTLVLRGGAEGRLRATVRRRPGHLIVTTAGDSGSVLLMALIMTSLLTALGLGLVSLTSLERLITANYRVGAQTLYAAEAVAEFSLRELARQSSWDDLLGNARQSSFTEAPVPSATGSVPEVDLSEMTTELQADTDTSPDGAVNTRWHLFAWGPLESLTAGVVPSMPVYAVAWVADDRFDGDGDPRADSNGRVVLHALALARGGVRRAVQIVVQEDVPVESVGADDPTATAVRVVSWREVR